MASLTHKLLITGSGEINEPRNRAGRYGIILPDYDQVYVDDYTGKTTTHMSRITFIFGKNLDGRERVADPAVWSQVIENGKSDFITMHERLERWIYSLNKKRSGLREGLTDWSSFTTGGTPEHPNAARAFTDNHGSDSKRSFVLGTFPDREPMKLKLALCGGAFFKIVGSRWLMGQDCWKIEAIDPNDPDFERYTPLTHPYLFFYPCVSGNLRINDDRGYFIGKEQRLAEPFWQFAYKSIMPIMGHGGVAYLPKRICRELSPEEKVPSPFWHSSLPQHASISPHYPNPYENV